MGILESIAIGGALALTAWGAVLSVRHLYGEKEDEVNKKEKATAAELAKTSVERIRNDEATAYAWLKEVGIVVAPFSLPVGMVATTAAKIAEKVHQGLRLKTEKMPEDWYEEVVKEASLEGKVFLGKCLKKRGHVTVEEAGQWLELESKKKEPQKTQAQTDLVAVYEQSGAGESSHTERLMTHLKGAKSKGTSWVKAWKTPKTNRIKV
jgi:hypothetical protein